MKRLTNLLAILLITSAFAQETGNPFVFTPEVMLGTSAEANENFPERNLQFQVLANFGWDQSYNTAEWANRLKGPKTGLSLGYTNLGNADSLGFAISVMPFIEFKAFNQERLKLLVGMGGSYFNKKFDPITNPNNMAISTDLVWSFRLFMYYNFLKRERMDWRLGVGYSHHSNGHTRLPNQGLNSFLVSLSADIKDNRQQVHTEAKQSYQKSRYPFLSVRAGYGVNSLSLAYNDKKPVYALAAEYGYVFNRTFSLSAGLYYRFYQHYYDYIADEEFLVRPGEEFDELTDAPGWNASNIGLFISGGVIMNHVGLDVQLGVNFHKPAYKIDWRINQGWDNTPKEIPEWWQLGEFDSKYKAKQAIMSRMGLKYFLWGMDKDPIHNIYAGFHINANLGQADFTELSIGYVYRLGK